ncbi:hypothetical protein GOODEAATRI_025864, partial [Goodea atripinnis]
MISTNQQRLLMDRTDSRQFRLGSARQLDPVGPLARTDTGWRESEPNPATISNLI